MKIKLLLQTPNKIEIEEISVLFGATEATNFELINSIAEWLFENHEPDMFKLPHTTIKQRSQQMAEAIYSY